MVEQLCYTWSTVSGSTGFQVCAVSDGVAKANIARFNEYLHYKLPPGTDPYTATMEKSPFCLAYASTGTERILVHKVYVGRDTDGRPGVYFAHLLADLFEEQFPFGSM